MTDAWKSIPILLCIIIIAVGVVSVFIGLIGLLMEMNVKGHVGIGLFITGIGVIGFIATTKGNK